MGAKSDKPIKAENNPVLAEIRANMVAEEANNAESKPTKTNPVLEEIRANMAAEEAKRKQEEELPHRLDALQLDLTKKKIDLLGNELDRTIAKTNAYDFSIPELPKYDGKTTQERALEDAAERHMIKVESEAVKKRLDETIGKWAQMPISSKVYFSTAPDPYSELKFLKADYKSLPAYSEKAAKEIVDSYIAENPHLEYERPLYEEYIAGRVYSKVYDNLVKTDNQFFADAFEAETGLNYKAYMKDKARKAKSRVEQLRKETRKATEKTVFENSGGNYRYALFRGDVEEEPYEGFLELLEMWEENDFISGLVTGFDAIDFLSFGLAGIMNEEEKQSVLKKVARGEKLTGNERNLFELIQIEEELSSVKDIVYGKTSTSASIGEGIGTTLEMLPEIGVSMYLTGGVGSFASLGGKAALKQAIKSGSKKELLKYGINTTGKLAYNYGLAKTRGFIAAPLMPSTYNSYLQSLNSAYSFDDSGNLVYTPVDKSKAYWGSVISTANEISSEYLGAGIGTVISLGGRGVGRIVANTKLAEVGKAFNKMPKLTPQAKVAMRTFGAQANPLTEAASEAVGDLMTTYEQSMIGLDVDYSHFNDGDYWKTLFGVSLGFGGSMALGGAALSYKQVKDAAQSRDKILENIDRRDLHDALVSISTNDDAILASSALADLDWDSFNDTDKEMARSFIIADLKVKIMEGAVDENARLESFQNTLEKIKDIVYQPKVGEYDETIFEATLEDGAIVYVINGLEADNTTGLLTVVNPADGKKTSVAKEKVSLTKEYSVGEYIQEAYKAEFSTEAEMKRVEDIKAKALQMANPTEVDVARVASMLNITLPKVGATVMLSNGNLGVVSEVLSPAEYAIQLADGTTYKVHFTELLSSDSLTAKAQTAIAIGETSASAQEVINTPAPATEAISDANTGATLDGQQVTIDGREGVIKGMTDDGSMYAVSFQTDGEADVEFFTKEEIEAQLQTEKAEQTASAENVNNVEVGTETTAEVETPQAESTVTQVATTEDGEVDIEQLSAEDAAKKLVTDLGDAQTAIAEVEAVVETLNNEREKERSKKPTSLSDISKKRKASKALDARIEHYNNVLDNLRNIGGETSSQQDFPIGAKVGVNDSIGTVVDFDPSHNVYGVTIETNDGPVTMYYKADKLQKAPIDNADATNTYTEVNTESSSAPSAETKSKGNNEPEPIGLIRNEAAMKMTDSVLNLVDTIGKRLGLTIEFVDDLKDSNGQRINGDIVGKKVRITTTSKRGVRFIIGHEFFHRIKDIVDADKYAEFIESIKDFVGDKRWNDFLERHRNTYRQHNGRIVAEALADMTDAEIVMVAESLGIDANVIAPEDLVQLIINTAVNKVVTNPNRGIEITDETPSQPSQLLPALVKLTEELCVEETAADIAGELVENTAVFTNYAESISDKIWLLRVLRKAIRGLKGFLKSKGYTEKQKKLKQMENVLTQLIAEAEISEAESQEIERVEGKKREAVTPDKGRYSLIGEQGARRSIIAPTFYSNAQYAVQNIKQDKATPEQWLKMIEKNGGLKAGEDKWLGLSDWLKASDKKTLTKDEVLQYIAENDIQIEEVSYGEPEYLSENEIYESDAFSDLVSSLTDYDEDDNPHINQERYKELQNADPDFLDGFSLDYWGEGLDIDDKMAAARYLGLLGVDNEINGTRLQYTTQGLTKKKEIALVVPTIEPYNQSDEIHFGDAGEGRAVAWIRFGDAEAQRSEEVVRRVDEFETPYKDVNGHEIYRPKDRLYAKDFISYGKLKSGEYAYVVYVNDKQIPVAHKSLEDARDALNEHYKANPEKRTRWDKVLVIDEIQSKRHQEGREKGYSNRSVSQQELYEAQEAAFSKVIDYESALADKYGEDEWAALATAEEMAEYERLRALDEAATNAYENYDKGVPSAPFEKNWAELAFKRMLRYAAENGYDYVAWTTGDQQADRYDIGSVVKDIVTYDTKDADGNPIKKMKFRMNNMGTYNIATNMEGVIVKGDGEMKEGMHLSDITGKPLAEKIMNGEGEDAMVFENGKDIEAKSLEGEELHIGNEGMKAFYDQMLPSFVKKYTKKWGAEVGEVTMPDLEENNTMHAVNVTDSMRESVMQGQPKFSLQTINALSDALFEYNTNGDIASFVDAVSAENARFGGHPYLTNLIMDYEEDGNADWFAEKIKGVIGEDNEDYAPYTAGGVRYSLSSSNKSVIRYDKENGTNVKEFFDFLRNGKVFEDGKPDLFHIANAGELLQRYGIKGKFMVGRFTYSNKHTKDEAHKLDVKEWVDVINTINTPLAIASYKGRPNEYRIYTYAMLNGENICVGVNVSLKNNEIELSNIISAYGRNINKLFGPELVYLLYPKSVKELKRKISQVSTEPNSPLNATSAASANKDTTSNAEIQTNEQKFSLITPEMDVSYLDAVERGDMATAQRMVMEAAKLAMPNTKVVDEDGNPKVVYHGTPNNFNAFSKEMFGASTDRGIWGNGFYFSDSEQYAKTYEKRGDKQGKTLSVFLNIKRPLFISLRNGGNEGAMYFHELMEKHFTDDIYEDVTRTDELMSVAQERLTADIVANGYDGIVVEYTNHIDTEYIAFEPNQIKSADPVTYDDAGNVIPLSERFNPEKEDIRYSVQTPSLLGVHNISLDKLRKVIKMGGLANPSVAVIDVDKQTHDDYGEYSLILPNNMVDARKGKNAGTWAGDAWTPTYPSIIKRMTDDKAISRFYKDIDNLPEAMRSRVKLDFDSFMEGRSANALAYWYLFEKGNAPEMVLVPSRYSDDVTNAVSEATNNSFSMYGLTPEERAKCLDVYIAVKFNGDRAAFEEEMQARIDRLTETIETKKSDRVKKWAQDTIDLIKEYGFDYDDVAKFIRDVEYDAREKGTVNVDATITAAREQVEANNLEADYDAWRNNLDERYGIEEYIFDGYTNSGDRRYLPHTVENASKWMKKQGRQGAVATFPSFGTFVAVSIPKMTTLESIRKRKALLGKSKEEYDAFREKWENVYYELGKKLQPDAKSFDDYGYWRLIEAAGHKNPKEFVKKEYNIELSEEDMAQLNDMLNAIRTNYPARYFETKFERPLQLSDFVAAVVPNDIPLDVESRLKDANVEIFEYEKGNSNSRAEAMQKASEVENVRFSLQSADASLMEHAESVKNLCELARGVYSITSSIVVAATKADYVKTIEEAGYNSEDSETSFAVYLKNTDTIAVNAENIKEKPIFVESITHENAHSITEKLLWGDVETIASSFNEEEIEALQKVALKGYDGCSSTEILDELISTFIQYFSTKQSGNLRLLDGCLKGYFNVDDLVNYMESVAINTYGERFTPIIKALMPILKKNIEINKGKYERQEIGSGSATIRFDRVREATKGDQRGVGKIGGDIEGFTTDTVYDSETQTTEIAPRYQLPDPDPSEAFYDEIPYYDEQGNEVDITTLPSEVAQSILDSKVRQMLEAEYDHNTQVIRREAQQSRDAINARYREEKIKRRDGHNAARTNAAKIDEIFGDTPFESLPYEVQALILIATGQAKIYWGDRGSNRGLASELGLKGSTGDRHAYRNIWGGAKKSFNEVVHDWWESIGGQESGIDDNDLRNALISALQSVQSSTDAMQELINNYDGLTIDRDRNLADVDHYEAQELRKAKDAYEQYSAAFELSQGEERKSYHDRAAQYFGNQSLSRVEGILEELTNDIERHKRKIERLKAEKKDMYTPLAEGIAKSKEIILHALERVRMFAGMEEVDLTDVARLINLVKSARSQRQVDNLNAQAQALVQRVSIKKAKANLARLLSLKLSNTDIIHKMLKENDAWTKEEREAILKHLWRVSRNGLRVSKAVHRDTKEIFDELASLVKNFKKEVKAFKGNDLSLKIDTKIAEVEKELHPDMVYDSEGNISDNSNLPTDFNEENKHIAKFYFKSYLQMLSAEASYRNAASVLSDKIENSEDTASANVDMAAARQNYLNALTELNTSLETLILEGKSQLRDWNAEKERHEIEIRKMGIDAIGGDKASAQRKPSSWGARARATYNITANAPYWTFETALLAIDHNSPYKKGKLYTYFMNKWSDANDNLISRYATHFEEMGEVMRQFFEKKTKNPYKLYQDVMREAESIAIGTLRYKEKGKDGFVRDAEIILNISNAMYIIAMWRQPRYKDAMESAYQITEKDIDALRTRIAEKNVGYLNMMDWVNNTFLPSTRLEYDVVYRKMNGGSMPKEINYFPARVAGHEEIDLANIGNSGLPTTPSALKDRVSAKIVPQLYTDYFKVLEAHLQDMDKWAAYAELTADLNVLLSSDEFRRRCDDYMGGLGGDSGGKGSLYDIFKKTSLVATGLYRGDAGVQEFFGYLQKTWATSNIAFRLWTAVKQISSVTTGITEGKYFAKQLAKTSTLVGIYSEINNAMALSPSLRYRWKSGNAGMEALAREAQRSDGYTKYRGVKEKSVDAIKDSINALVRAGMTPNAAVDLLACSIVFNSVYDKEIANATGGKREATEDEKRAAVRKAERAFNTTQQSSEGAYLSVVQATPSWGMLTTYMNASFALHRKRYAGLREILKLTKPSYRRYIKDEFGVDAVKQSAKEALNDIISGIAGELSFAAMGWGLTTLMSALTGWNEDDEDDIATAKAEFVDTWWHSFLNGYLVGSLLTSALQGFDVSLTPAYDEFFKDAAGIFDGKGDWRQEVAIATTKYGLGIDLKALFNIAAGIENMVKEERDEYVGSVLKFLNAPNRYVKAFVGDRREGETLEQYQTRIVRFNTLLIDVVYEHYFDEDGKYIGTDAPSLTMSKTEAKELRSEYETAYSKDVLLRYGGTEEYKSFVETDKKHKQICSLLGFKYYTKPSEAKAEQSDLHWEMSYYQEEVAYVMKDRKNWVGSEEDYYDLLIEEQEAKNEFINSYYEYIKSSGLGAY